LGSAGHYPAIDVLQSVSRLASQVATPDQKVWSQKVREAMAAYQRAQDLILLAAYTAGSNTKLDAAIRVRQELEDFLRQDSHLKSTREETLTRLEKLAAALTI